MNPNGDVKDAKTKTLLEQAPEGRRALFGDPGSHRADLPDANQVETRLNKKDGEIIVWVEDRHYFTQPETGQGSLSDMPDPKMHMDGYGGVLAPDDAVRIQMEEKSVARPWIPLEISLPLLSKQQDLEDAQDPPPTAPRRCARWYTTSWGSRISTSMRRPPARQASI